MGWIFVIGIVVLILWCAYDNRPKKKKLSPPADREKERARIVAHRNKRTLIIPPDKKAKDETQVLYFSTSQHRFVEGKDI